MISINIFTINFADKGNMAKMQKKSENILGYFINFRNFAAK